MPRQITKVGKYEIVEKIAKGGMGAVYKAKHPTLKRFVILKQLVLRTGTGIIARFKREASLMIDFRDEHIVPVYDHFKSGSSYYIVMEYVDGTSLDKLIEERKQLSNEAVILIFSEICKGLRYAHNKGVIHRDIKPANILISREGEVKLVDFGIATTKEAGEDGLTRAGMTLGTPAYMSPEQIADTKKVDKRADIYSMGVMLYEMLTGKKPFPSSFTAEAIDLISRGAYRKPQKLNPSIPRFLRRVIKKTMNHKLKKRYRDLQSVIDILSKYTRRYRSQKAIRDDIKKYMSGSEVVLPTTFAIAKRGKKTTGALWLPFIILAAFFIAAAGGFYFYYRGYYFEYFKPKEYGKLRISAAVPAEYYKEAGSVYARARLSYQIDLDVLDLDREDIKIAYSYRLSPPREVPFSKYLKKDVPEPEVKLLTTKVVYLPAGIYHLELNLENQKIYKALYLNPRVIQRQNMDTLDGRTIQFDLHESESKPISIAHRVTDSVSGKSIDDETDIYIYLEDAEKWINWKTYSTGERSKRYLKDYLKSGKDYSFKYEASGYYTERIDFYVESNLDSALVDVSLVKKPGSLVIESDYEGLELLIDNRKENYIGERKKSFSTYGGTVVGKKEFMLAEGNYILTVKRDSRHMQNAQFKIFPEKSTILKVSYDAEEKEIHISQ